MWTYLEVIIALIASGIFCWGIKIRDDSIITLSLITLVIMLMLFFKGPLFGQV